MVRFFVSPFDVSSDYIALTAEDNEHIRALRLRPDELFVVCDGNGVDYICCLGERDRSGGGGIGGVGGGGSGGDGSGGVGGGSATAKILRQQQSVGEPSVTCSVYIAFQKGDRLDYAVQKSVELGAKRIVLYESERCVATPHDIIKKIARLQRIALETAKLSGRGIIPEVTSVGKFDMMIDDAASRSALSLFFYECEEDLSVRDILTGCEIESVSIITGPEGGFEPHEAKMARSKGFHVASLGPRILRSETAPVVALAAVMYQSGNF
ncbi:MAG: 16S rRNA (uracil(1498)-N(3))-methyltransferase [Oscillospiraceae bacterium]|jgi:16S rRNA (uracil1498-N3)-methyltransferase|nr:16S rRNA (uracil(1498)-N(3))-methyltransferase [Oscillospiraceae bacterium]